MSTAERVRLPDDCTVGYIVEGLLGARLLPSSLFHSHLENLQRLPPDAVLQQVQPAGAPTGCSRRTHLGDLGLETRGSPAPQRSRRRPVFGLLGPRPLRLLAHSKGQQPCSPQRTGRRGRRQPRRRVPSWTGPQGGPSGSGSAASWAPATLLSRMPASSSGGPPLSAPVTFAGCLRACPRGDLEARVEQPVPAGVLGQEELVPRW